MLVYDESIVNILFGSAFDQIEVDHELTAISEQLLGFTDDRLIPREKITLTVNFEEPSCHTKKFMAFLVVDTRFGRPALKDLKEATSIHHLVMKFLTAATREGASPTVMTIRTEVMDVDQEKDEQDMVLDEGLNPQIMGPDSSVLLVEELETFPMSPSDPSWYCY
ncbi:Uncharacterized protein Adt_31536 [Abeliophyllum distichum]|uniref:Uncharacterized protein n=1 Tax=Abeliophyllum distichum TaxID=126358 RepID=A0ABD1RED6_9LAMI